MKKIIFFFALFSGSLVKLNAIDPQEMNCNITRARSTLDSQIYQAIWALNVSMVSNMLALHETLSATEKKQLLDIARRRFEMCSQKKITTQEKLERLVKSFHLLAMAYGILRLGTAVDWLSTIGFFGSFANWLRNFIKKHGQNSNLPEGWVVGKALELNIPILLIVSGSVAFLGAIRLFSVLRAITRDQDANQAEEIERLISIIPVRN